jgi:hypothetical protein
MLLSCQKTFIVEADHKNLLFFADKVKLNQRQFRWAILLADFNFKLCHISGGLNLEADALSRSNPSESAWSSNPNHQQLFKKSKDNNLEFVAKELKDVIPGDLEDFPLIIDLPPLPVERQKANLLVMRVSLQKRPSDDKVGEIFSQFHDHKIAGHGGFDKTLDLLFRHGYNWWGLRMDLKRYLKNCLECARSKTQRHKKYGLLHPLPIPLQPWSEIAMDFITQLPLSDGMNQIWVVKDRLTKRGHFIACHDSMTTLDLTYLFIEHVFRLHGLPSFITSDRDKLFVANLWRTLTKELNIGLRMSTKGHPETDGASEILNQWIEQYIRIFCNYEQNNWKKLLPLAEYSYNNSSNSAISTSPFVADLGYQPRSWVEPTKSSLESSKDSKFNIHRKVDERITLLRELMSDAQIRYSKYANESRMEGPKFNVGDKVMLNRKFIKTLREKMKFDFKFFGPFEISKKINDVAFKLKLPNSWKIHDTFHISLLEPFGTDPFPNQRKSPPPTEIIENEEEYIVEQILDHRKIKNNDQFLVKWKGYSNEYNTWEPEAHLVNATDVLQDFLDSQKDRDLTVVALPAKNRLKRGGSVTSSTLLDKSPKTRGATRKRIKL